MFSLFKLPKDASFSNKEIILFLLPILFEQILLTSLLMADTLMISRLPGSESALAGIANVSRLDTMFKQIFVAFAAGGGIFIAQFLGAKRYKDANKSLKMSITSMVLIAIIIAAILEIFKVTILNFLFGEVEEKVMNQSLKYYTITILTYPFMALFNCGTASFRSMGKSKITMYASVVMMSINLGFKYLFLFPLKLGVTGAGMSQLIAYAITGIALFIMLCSKKNKVYIDNPLKFEWDGRMIARIYKVVMPTGIENGIFQLGALILQSLVASLGIVAINADHLTHTMANLIYAPAVTFTLGIIPFVSKCMGAGRVDEAEFYTRHIVKLDHMVLAVFAIIYVPLIPTILKIFNMSDEILREAARASTLYFIAMPLMYPKSFAIPSALRGTGDTAFTMIVAAATMFLFRIGFAYLLVKVFDFGMIAIWIAMVSDWLVRGTIFSFRLKKGKWRKNHIIDI